MATVLARMPGARKVTGVTRVPSRRPEVQPGEQAEGHPRLGDRLPGPADLRDLDEVVHQRDAREAGLRRRRGHRCPASPPDRAPAEPGDLQHEAEPGRTACCAAAAAALPAACDGSTAVSGPAASTVQPSAAISTVDGSHPAQLAVEHGGGHRAGAGAVPALALGGRGGEQDGDGRQPGRAGELELGPGAWPGPARACPRRWSARAAAGRRRSGRAARTRPRRRPGHARRCRRRRGAVRGDDLGLPVARLRPGRLAGSGRAGEHHQSRVRDRRRRHCHSVSAGVRGSPPGPAQRKRGSGGRPRASTA